MSKPWKYVKDARCTTIRIPNFADSIRRARGEHINLQYDEPYTVANRDILMNFKFNTFDGINYLGIHFNHISSDEDGNDEIAVASIVCCFYLDKQVLMEMKNGKPLECSTGQRYGSATALNLDEILAPDSGYLVDGSLEIHVEIRIDCLIGKDGIRRFNFWDPVSKWLEIQCVDWDSPLYTPKQPFLHHCKQFDEQDIGSIIEFERPPPQASCELFLQRVNGVMITIDDPFVFRYAYHLGAHLLLRLGEPNDFEKKLPELRYKLPNNMGLFKKTVEDIKNIEDLKKFVEDCEDKGKMTAEHLKTIVKKFFSFA